MMEKERPGELPAPGQPGWEAIERLPGDELRRRFDAAVEETEALEERLRQRIGRWHSTCVDCSD